MEVRSYIIRDFSSRLDNFLYRFPLTQTGSRLQIIDQDQIIDRGNLLVLIYSENSLRPRHERLLLVVMVLV